AGAHVGLEGRLIVQWVVHDTQGRWQVFDISQFAIQAGNPGRSTHALNANLMAEGGRGQQFDPDLVGQHISKDQTQLGIAVKRGTGSASSSTIEIELAAVLARINRNRTCTNDDIASLVSLSDGSSQQSGGEQQNESKL